MGAPVVFYDQGFKYFKFSQLELLFYVTCFDWPSSGVQWIRDYVVIPIVTMFFGELVLTKQKKRNRTGSSQLAVFRY